jgi:serine/threonine protein kinase
MSTDHSEVEERARCLYADFLIDQPEADEEALREFIEAHLVEADVLRRLVAQRHSAAGILGAALPQETLSERASRAKVPSAIQMSAHSIKEGLVLDDFELVRLLGRGGMGEVWEAQQLTLNRRVALKLILPERVGARGKELFEREARAGARLTHPGLIAVYESGETNGLLWIAMELVEDGFDLRRSIEGLGRYEDLPQDYAAGVARLVAKMADALVYAHGAGVVHRDLKPQNILITPENAPKITDFGLARIVDEVGLSRTGEFAGTYYYMSPEQAAAKRAGIDHRTDVFSLGVVMYELLSLHRPFEGDTSQQVTQKILFEEPPALTSLRSKLPWELSVICGKALEKNRDHRYLSMADFAGDLRRFLANEPILARAPSVHQRLRKWTRRNPAKAVAGAMAVAALIVTSVLLADNVQKRSELSRSLEARNAALTQAEDARIEAAALAKVAAQEADTTQEVLNFMVGMFEMSDPTGSRGKTITAREILDGGVAQIEEGLVGRPVIRARLQHEMAGVYRSLGLYDQAVELEEEVLATWSENLRPEDADTMSARHNLALLYKAQGRYEDAEVLFVQNITLSIEADGEDSGRVLSTQNSLGHLYSRMGRYQEAEELHLKCLAARRRILGSEHERTIDCLNSLGALYNTQGQHLKAELYLREVLEYRRGNLGEDHLDTVNATYNFALVLGGLDRLDEAGVLFARVVKKKRALFGHTHPSTLNALNGHAANFYRQDRMDEAAALFQEVYDGRVDSLGSDHPDTLGSLQNLGIIYRSQGQLDRAKEAYLAVISGQRMRLGEDHPDTLMTSGNLGQLYTAMGDFEAAEEILLDSVERSRRLRGEAHPETISLIQSAAKLRMAQGMLDAAVDLYVGLCDSIESRGGRDDPDFQDTISTLNGIAWGEVDPDREGGDVRLGLEMAQIVAARAPHSPAYLDTLAWALFANGAQEEAVEASSRALELAPEDQKAEYGGYLQDLRRRIEVQEAAEAAEDGGGD